MTRKSVASRKTKSAKQKTAAKQTAAKKKTAAKKSAAKKFVTAEGTGAAGTLRTAALRTKPVGAAVVETLEEPPKLGPAKRKIHRRRVLPEVVVGAEVMDLNPSPRANFGGALPLAAMAGLEAATDNVVLVKNTELGRVADNNTASNVGEPSVASNGQVVFYTGNWYAAISVDGGDTFRFVNPNSSFPNPPNQRFCCDQVVHYIKKIDTFVWLLQYGRTDGQEGDNIQRLAFARTADAREGRWRLFDITTQAVGLPGLFLDFPDLAVGTNMLYMTTNAFEEGAWRASVVVRLPLAGIKSGNITAQRFISRGVASLRVAQNCTTRAIFAGHVNTSTLRVFTWDENSTQVTPRDVAVARWAGGNGYLSRTPDGGNWLGRADPRLTGATVRGSEVWFAWGSNRGGVNNRPHPFVQIARLRTSDFAVIDNVNIWDPSSATCYAALSTNSASEVGVSYMVGGGPRFPSHVVGILTGTRKDAIVAEGVRAPDDEQWGDYLTVRRHYPKQRLFSATGFTLQGGAAQDSTPRYVLFGRAGEV
jgi:hypothetical protein